MHSEGLITFSWTLPMVMVTLIILYLILKKYFFEKVRNYMLAREQKVKDSFDNAEEVNRIAEDRLATYNTQLESAESERREILKDAKARADESAAEIIREAEAKAADMIRKATNEISKERTSALEDMKEQIAFLAIYAAEQIIEQKLNAADHQEIIDGVIRQVSEEQGGAEWSH